MKRVLIILLIAFPFIIKAEVNIKLMAAYQNQSVYKGAVTWPKASAMVGPMFVFYKRFFLAGPSFYYAPFDRDNHHYINSGLRYYDDGEPLIKLSDHEKDYRNERKATLNGHFLYAYNFGFKKKFKIGGKIEKDFTDHKGLHTELNLGAPFLPFTSLGLDIGYGEKSSNQYLYGPSSQSGMSYSAFNLNAVYPFVPWDGVAMINLKRSWVLQGQNKQAYYIRGDHINDQISLRLFWNAL